MSWFRMMFEDTGESVPHGVFDPGCDCDGGIEVKDPTPATLADLSKYGIVLVEVADG